MAGNGKKAKVSDRQITVKGTLKKGEGGKMVFHPLEKSRWEGPPKQKLLPIPSSAKLPPAPPASLSQPGRKASGPKPPPLPGAKKKGGEEDIDKLLGELAVLERKASYLPPPPRQASGIPRPPPLPGQPKGGPPPLPKQSQPAAEGKKEIPGISPSEFKKRLGRASLELDDPFADMEPQVQTPVDDADSLFSDSLELDIEVGRVIPESPKEKRASNNSIEVHFSYVPPQPGEIAETPREATSMPPAVAVPSEALMESLKSILNSLRKYDEKKELTIPPDADPVITRDKWVKVGTEVVGRYMADKAPPYVRIYFHRIGWENREDANWQKRARDRIEKHFTNNPKFVFFGAAKIKFIAVYDDRSFLAYSEDEISPITERVILSRR